MIKIQGAEQLDNKIKPVYNPLSELMLALDLLCSPEHHMLHLPWASDVIMRLSHKEKEQLAGFEKLVGGYLNLDLHIDYLAYDYDSPINLSVCTAFINDSRHWISSLAHAEMRKVASFICHMWDNYIVPVVQEHLQVVREQIAYGESVCRSEGGIAFLQQVSDRISLEKNRMLVIEKWVEADFSASGLVAFYVQLSLFAFPHLVVSERSSDGFFSLSWDVKFKNDKLIAPGIDRISSAAFALSDKSRLRILLMLTDAPMTQKALGRLMGFAKSTISRHVNILIDSGFVLQEEGGRNVLLKLNKNRIENFSAELVRWLGN